ncbi:unnamed protein product [Sphacelaria rigidula]
MALGVSLGSEKVMVSLSEDQSILSWQGVDSVSSPTRGSVQVARVEKVKPTGSAGLALMGKGHSKELELEAEDAATRDTWVTALTELVARSKETGEIEEAEVTERAEEQAESDALQKSDYWSTRRNELAQIEAAAAERKKKYANTGMKHTAEAMARR